MFMSEAYKFNEDWWLEKNKQEFDFPVFTKEAIKEKFGHNCIFPWEEPPVGKFVIYEKESFKIVGVHDSPNKVRLDHCQSCTCTESIDTYGGWWILQSLVLRNNGDGTYSSDGKGEFMRFLQYPPYISRDCIKEKLD